MQKGERMRFIRSQICCWQFGAASIDGANVKICGGGRSLSALTNSLLFPIIYIICAGQQTFRAARFCNFLGVENI